MNNFQCFIVFLSISIVLSNSADETMKCLQGYRISEKGKTRSTLRYEECNDPNGICHRYDITASSFGETGK